MITNTAKILSVSLLGLACVASWNAQANEDFSIMNDRLRNAIEDNSLNDNEGTHARVNEAYNAAKQAVNGSMDTSKSSALTPDAPTQNDSATGKQREQANRQRTRSQVLAGGNAEINAQIEAEHQAVLTGKALEQANRQRTRQQVLAGGVAEVNTQIQAEKNATHQSISGAAYRQAITTMQQASINTSAASLPSDTNVNVTVDGKTTVTTAGAIASATPDAQISVPFNSAFHPSVKGGHDGATKGGFRGDRGTGAGADNAHDHAFGGHTGAGHGFHM